MTVKELRKLWLMKLKNRQLYCYLCGELIAHQSDLSADHVIPRAHGGETTPDNLKPAHKYCNSRKGCMSLDEYRQWLETKQKGGKSK